MVITETGELTELLGISSLFGAEQEVEDNIETSVKAITERVRNFFIIVSVPS